MSTVISPTDVEFARHDEVAELGRRVSDLELTVIHLRELIPAREVDNTSRSYFRAGWDQLTAEERSETLAFLEAQEKRSRASRVDG
jgi:hypothetical protein